MSTIDEVSGTVGDNAESARELAGRIAQSKSVLESLSGAFAGLGANDKQGEADACGSEAETLAAQAHALADALDALRSRTEMLKGLLRDGGGTSKPFPEPTAASPLKLDFSKPVFDDRKLTEYALKPDHPVGGNKARVIQSRTGLGLVDAAEVKRQILKKAPYGKAVPGKTDEHGSRWHIDLPLTGPSGTMQIRTAWITGSSGTKLVTISFPPKGES